MSMAIDATLMRLELTGRRLTITPALRQLVEQRLSQILRMLNDSAVSTQVVLTRERSRSRADITVHVRGEHFLHAQSTGRGAALAVGAAAGKIARQVETLRGKWSERKRRGVPAARVQERSARVPRPRRAPPSGRGAGSERGASGSSHETVGP